jgi:hypothetical protein
MEISRHLAYSAGVNRRSSGVLLLVSVIAFSIFCAAQNVAPVDRVIANAAQAKPQSLCKLANVSMGNHQSVRVAAVAEAGTDMGVLSDPGCPTRQPMWFELALKSPRNRTELSEQLEKSGKAVVLLSGELYGPPEPDPKLPDSIRKNYHPGWGHLGAFPMKLVVFRIESVAPAGKPYNER